METMLVRLKAYDPRRGHVLRRYTYRGIKFQEDRGWYRVEKDVADYLRTVRQVATNEHSPLAFDVCTDAEAQAMDKKEQEAENQRKAAADNIKLSRPRDGRTSNADGSSANSKDRDEGDSHKKPPKK